MSKLYVKWKGYDDSFNIWIDKKVSFYKMSYFLEPYARSKNQIKVELDLANYATNLIRKAKQVSIHQSLLTSLI